MLTLLTRSQFRVLSSSKSSRFLRIPTACPSPQFRIKPSRPATAPSSHFKPQPRTLPVAANHSFSTTSRIFTKMAPIKKDPNSQANHLVFTTTHTDINLILSFPTSSLSGDVTLALKATEDTLEDVVLDTSYLDVKSVCVDGEKATFDVSERVEPYGSALTINTGKEVKEGQCIKVKISYGTTDRCTALQWMTPEQTSNKKHPYMFSQCQAIHARSLYPCQDTPAVKSPFNIKIRSPLPVLTSGLPTGTREFIAGNSKDEAGTLLYTSHQSIPIPSYLFAIASGDIASASIGPRSLVYTGPEELLACKTELEGDMEKFMEAAESLVYPYPWTTYNVLILPPSFPYGGMENPTHTFATPTIISGDKSNIDVIAHELSHSWSGNLVSNASWEHFWLNEGWTTYLERRIGGILHGDKEFHFSAIIGWKALKESVQLYGEDHEFTKLVVDLEGKNPDDAFSSIPYEKGFNFLFFLDRVVGRAKWDKFIPHYFKKFHQKSLTSEDFKSTLLEFFASDAEASAALEKKVDWEKWFHAPGLPPKPDFDTSLADVCYSLADKWLGLNTDSPPSGGWTPGPKDIESWTSGQIVVFLEKITDFEKPLKPELVETMINQYGFMKSKNAEILSRMLIVGLKAKDPRLFQPAAEALGTWGRMKFVRPLYRLLNECDRELAVKTFKAHINFYHPICRDAVKKDLKLD